MTHQLITLTGSSISPDRVNLSHGDSVTFTNTSWNSVLRVDVPNDLFGNHPDIVLTASGVGRTAILTIDTGAATGDHAFTVTVVDPSHHEGGGKGGGTGHIHVED